MFQKIISSTSGLLAPTPAFYITATIITILVGATAIIIIRFQKPTTETHKQFKNMILAALWTCLGLQILVLFSSWQQLPVIGLPKTFLLVILVLLIWLLTLWIYSLIVFPKKLYQEHRSKTYTRYLPTKK